VTFRFCSAFPCIPWRRYQFWPLLYSESDSGDVLVGDFPGCCCNFCAVKYRVLGCTSCRVSVLSGAGHPWLLELTSVVRSRSSMTLGADQCCPKLELAVLSGADSHCILELAVLSGADRHCILELVVTSKAIPFCAVTWPDAGDWRRQEQVLWCIFFYF
jgi:hypothetical protein